MVASRYIFQCIFSFPSMIKDVNELQYVTKFEWFLIVASGICQMISSGCAFLSLIMLPIMDATTLIKIQPIFVNFLSWVWLKEPITWLDFMMTAVLMGGVVLVCEPAFIFQTAVIQSSHQTTGQILAIVAALTSGIATCMVRRIRNTGTAVILFWQGVVVVTLSVVIGLSLGHSIEPSFITYWLFLLAAAVGESLYRIFLTAALMVEEAAIVASFQTVEILFSLIYELTAFLMQPSLLDIFGALLIVIGVIILACKYQIIQATRCRCNTSGSSENSYEKDKLITC